MLLDPIRRDEGFRRLMAMYGDSIYWHIRRIVVGLSESFRQAACLDI